MANLTTYYVRQSRTFQVFNELAQYDTLSFKAFQQRAGCSQSVIYQTINRLNQEVSGLSLSFSNLGIKGDEVVIRHVLFTIYWSLFGGGDWPFISEKGQLLDILQMEEGGANNLSEFEREKRLFWLAIVAGRLRKGNTVPDTASQLGEPPVWVTMLCELSQFPGDISRHQSSEFAFLLRTRYAFESAVGGSGYQQLVVRDRGEGTHSVALLRGLLY